MNPEKSFLKELAKLNPQQRDAVNSTDGPVMVVAGPGTGKTQVLTLRIANILHTTDTPASGILCLTFTRSGVTAMRRRLEEYIGTTARNVTITTFHSFAISLIEKYYYLLDFGHVPKLLDDQMQVALADELLQNRTWQYIRPRHDNAKYFHDIVALISILKRERITPEQFSVDIDTEIKQLENDPENISSRGPTKGQLKSETIKKIDGLRRTMEVMEFYQQYEQLKQERELMDYNDVLEYIVTLAETSDEVRAHLQENYLYVLVDEHQDSSGIQNAFLRSVWTDIEKPNIFVVGDDRQLIYGFSGANLDYFNQFKTLFGPAKLITLTENYRSTAPVLSLADELLQSSVVIESLHANRTGDDIATLSAYHYGRDEIIGAGLYFKKLIDEGVPMSECALLLPKNYQVKQAVGILRTMGLPVVSESQISLAVLPETTALIHILQILINPYDTIALSSAILDATSGIPPLAAHTFLKSLKKPEHALTIESMIQYGSDEGLFAGGHPVSVFGKKLAMWVETVSQQDVLHIISTIGNELLIDTAENYETLITRIEIVRSLIHAVTTWQQSTQDQGIAAFLEYFNRMLQYGTNISVAHLTSGAGISVMTLHKSKGLEYDHVWIGHMNQEILMGEKSASFTLPESVKIKLAERDILTAKRELYVAITRAKKHVTISYAQQRENGSEMRLADIIADLSAEHFINLDADTNQQNIIENNPRNYTLKPVVSDSPVLDDITALVRERFTETVISVSMLNNFFECPWTWYFRNFLKLPETKSASLSVGSAVHSSIEYILGEKTLPNKGQILDYLQYALTRESVTDESNMKQFIDEGYTAVQNWIDRYYADLAVDRVSERNISFRDKRFPNLSMYGKIDLTERFPDGSIIVSDFKTGSSKTSGVIEKYDDEGRLSKHLRQLAMYSYLIDGAEGNTVRESRLVFLEEDQKNKNALYSTHITTEQVDMLVRDIADYQQTLLDGTWTGRPCNNTGYSGQTCQYCARIEKILEKK